MANPLPQSAARNLQPPVQSPVQSSDLPDGYTRISKAEKRVYYSRYAGGLHLHVNVGEQVMGPKGPTTFGEKIVQFHPLNPTESGGMPYGRFETTDQETIDFLERRIVESGDVMSAEQFALSLQSPEDDKRTIASKNQLIADLQRKNEEQARQLAEARK